MKRQNYPHDDCVHTTPGLSSTELEFFFSISFWPQGEEVSLSAPRFYSTVYTTQWPVLRVFHCERCRIRTRDPGFRSRPVLRRFWLRESSTRSRLQLRLLVKENKSLDFFKSDYELSKIRSNTCTST